MGHGHKFNPKKLERLKDPERLAYLHPDTIWEMVSGEEVRSVVDLGAGLGFLAIPFSRKIPDGTVYACDLSEEMLHHLGEELRAAEAANVVPVKTEEVAVPLADGIAHLVVMVHLHHELDHPERTLAECRRLLVPGGRLAVIDWKPQETPAGPPIHVRIQPETVVAQMEAAGFVQAATLSGLPHHYVITSRTPA